MILVYVTNSRINFDSTSYNRQMVTTACSYQEPVLGSRCAEKSEKARKDDKQVDDAVAIRCHGKAAAFFSRHDFFANTISTHLLFLFD